MNLSIRHGRICMSETVTINDMQFTEVCKTVIRPVLMYGSETWAMRKADQNLLERTEMRMLRLMMRIKGIEKIRNEEIRGRAGVANISKTIIEARLRWLGLVERKTEEDVVIRTWKMEVGVHRKIGRQKLRWSDVIRKYMKEKQVKIEEAQDGENVEIENLMRRPPNREKAEEEANLWYRRYDDTEK